MCVFFMMPNLLIMLYRNIELCELQVQDIKFGCVGPAPYYIPHFKVHLDGRKGWQNKAGYDGPRESAVFCSC
jgi:hypothetical protein